MGAGTLSQPAQRTVVRPGIVAALPGEARALVRLRAQGSVQLPGGARVALSGLGAQRARATARRLVAEGADGLVSWGSAAGLVAALAPGDLLLPRTVIGADGSGYTADADWLGRLVEAIGDRARIRHGALVESVEVVSSIAAKQALHARSQALATDMESAAIAAVAADYELPFIAVRAIADDAGMVLPPAARAAVDAAGALQPIGMMRALAGRPRTMHAQLRALKQLAVAFKAAQNTLTRVAPCLLGERSE